MELINEIYTHDIDSYIPYHIINFNINFNAMANMTNIWHSPKEILPEGEEQILIYTDTHLYYVADFDKKSQIFYDIINRPHYIDDVIGWKYINECKL